MLKADHVNGIKTKFAKSHFKVVICGWVSNLKWFISQRKIWKDILSCKNVLP